MKQSSSTIFAVCGISSLTHAPDCPCCANWKSEGTMGNVACVAVMPVSRWPLRIESGRSVPFHFCSSGL